MPDNKVKYNLKNTHYALLSFDSDGEPVFGDPIPMPGAVSLSLDANGEPENFYADGIAYYVINNNMGYDGDLELALIPDSFRTDVLNESVDGDGVMVENANAQLNPFALLFQFDGDQKDTRHVLYNCSASRPGIEGKTNEESKEIQTETISLKATPLPNGAVKAKTTRDTDSTVYNSWFSEVHLPSPVPEDATLSALTIGSLTLTPDFGSDTTEYTASTYAYSAVVTAVAASQSASVEVKVNGTTIENGSEAEWESGNNSVVIKVTNGSAAKTYTVTVNYADQ